MEQVGKVVSVNDGMAKVAVRKISACGTNCSACSGSCNQEPQIIDIIDTLGVKEGDYVEVKGDSGRILKYMLLLYGLPLLFMIVGFGVSYSIFLERGYKNYELLSLCVGFVCLLAGGLAVKLIDSKSNIKSYNVNYMVKKL